MPNCYQRNILKIAKFLIPMYRIDDSNFPRRQRGTDQCKTVGKSFHASLIFPFQQLFTMEEEAAEIKPKQAVWLLDEKLGLCIECEQLMKAEKKMSLTEYCRMVET